MIFQDNKHSKDEIMAFAHKLLDRTDEQRAQLIRDIEEFHEDRCTAPDKYKGECLQAFTAAFVLLLMQTDEERAASKN